MAILRSEIRNKYTTVPNSVIRAKDILDSDYRLLMYLYSLPNGWKINQNFLGNELNCSRININRKIRRLKDAGYLEIIKASKENAADYIYVLKVKESESNVSENDVSENDVSENDVSENDVSKSDTLINTDIINTNIIKKDNINILPKEKKEKVVNCDLFKFIEENFGRTLSSIEYELISKWNDNELTRYAIRQAVLNRAFNLKYVDKILFNYKKENIKTVAEAEERDRKFQESKTTYKNKKEESEWII